MTIPTRDRRRKRYADDPDYRSKVLAWNRAYHAAHRAEISAQHRRKWANDPEYRKRCLARARERDWRKDKLKQCYGISLDDYHAMLARQDGACAICRKTCEETLGVDHCHRTGAVRGLLCRKCNTGLGCYDDDPNLIRTAIGYLAAAARGIARAPGSPSPRPQAGRGGDRGTAALQTPRNMP